jgi:hypothetical protein
LAKLLGGDHFAIYSACHYCHYNAKIEVFNRFECFERFISIIA